MKSTDLQIGNLLNNEKLLYLLLISISAAFSVANIQGSVINRDAIVYLSTAEAFLQGGLSATLQIYGWPAYAILGALLSKTLNISIENSFYLINSIFYAVIPAVFLKLYTTATNNRHGLLIAALASLLLPAFNGYREMIIRDVGYWLFSLLALLYFFQFIRTQKTSHALQWQLAIAAAFMFRSEAIAWIIGLPLCLFWVGNFTLSARLKSWLTCTSIYICALIAACVFLLINDAALETLLKKIPSTEAFTNSLYSLKTAQENMATYVLNPFSKEYAPFILNVGLIAHLIHTLLLAVSWPYLVFTFIAIRKNANIEWTDENKIALWAIAINLAMLTTFVLAQQFMIERYTVLTALLILLLISQPISDWTESIWPNASAWIKYGLVFIAIVLMVDIVTTKNPPPTNLISAGEWLKQNTTPHTPVALSDNRLLHYSGRLREGVTCLIDRDLRISLASTDKLKAYAYLVIQTKQKSLQQDTMHLVQEGVFHEIKTFKRGKSVTVIFKNETPQIEQVVSCNPYR